VKTSQCRLCSTETQGLAVMATPAAVRWKATDHACRQAPSVATTGCVSPTTGTSHTVSRAGSAAPSARRKGASFRSNRLHHRISNVCCRHKPSSTSRWSWRKDLTPPFPTPFAATSSRPRHPTVGPRCGFVPV